MALLSNLLNEISNQWIRVQGDGYILPWIGILYTYVEAECRPVGHSCFRLCVCVWMTQYVDKKDIVLGMRLLQTCKTWPLEKNVTLPNLFLICPIFSKLCGPIRVFSSTPSSLFPCNFCSQFPIKWDVSEAAIQKSTVLLYTPEVVPYQRQSHWNAV